MYNEFANRWEITPMLLKKPIEGAGLVVLNDNEIMFIGGKTQFGTQIQTLVYNLDTGNGTIGPNLVHQQTLSKCIIYEDQILCYGGQSSDEAYILLAENKEWKKKFTPTLFDKSLMNRVASARSY